MEGQLLGRVTWFNEAKGYGEIISEKNQVFFFTYHQLRPAKSHRTIKQNAVVSFVPLARKSFGIQLAGEVKVTKVQLELGLDISKDLVTSV